MAPSEFIFLKEFHSRTMWPGEAVTLYLYDLKRLLQQAMPGLAKIALQPLLLHQFLLGLPDAISQQLRASGDTKDLNKVQRAKMLMTVMEQGQAAALATTPTPPNEVDKLKTQITQLTEKVAALTVKQSSNKRCFYCNQLGHTKHSCPTCLTNTGAIDQGTMLGTAGRETTKGCLSGAASIPHISKPQQHCYCSYGCTIKPHAASVVGKVGGVSTEIMLDSGSSVSLLSQETAIQLTGVKQQPLPQVQLQTASGKSLPIKDYVIVDVQLDMMSTSICHNFLIVISLIAPVILGTDFFQQHGLILDFTKPTIHIYPKQDDIPVDNTKHLEYCSTTKATHKNDCSY